MQILLPVGRERPSIGLPRHKPRIQIEIPDGEEGEHHVQQIAFGPALAPRPPRWVVDRYKLEASICRESFYDFVVRFWPVLYPSEPLEDNWHIKFLCDEMQAVAERVFAGQPKEYDLVINVPPLSSKSTICSRMFQAWTWTRMPHARHVCISHTMDLARDLALDCRNILKSEKWHQLFGNIALSHDQDAKQNYRNNHGGSRKSLGVDGSITGHHGHFTCIDDPIKAQSTVLETEIHTANRFISETLGLRKTNALRSPTILIMQRLHHLDPTSFFIDLCKRGGTKVRHIRLPVEVRGNPYDGQISPREVVKNYLHHGGMLDPRRWSQAAIRSAKASLNSEYAIEGQLYQNPVPRSGGQFKIDRIHIDTPPAPHKLNWRRQVVRFWDKAGSRPDEKKKRCFTAGVKMGEDTFGRIWILDVKKFQEESAARERRIRQTAEMDGKRVKVGVEQEPGSGGKESAENTIRHTLKGFSAEAVRPTGDKETRADPFSTQVNAGNVYLAKGDWNEAYLAELGMFPGSKWVDQVDASSGAFEMLTRYRKKAGIIK